MDCAALKEFIEGIREEVGSDNTAGDLVRRAAVAV